MKIRLIILSLLLGMLDWAQPSSSSPPRPRGRAAQSVRIQGKVVGFTSVSPEVIKSTRNKETPRPDAVLCCAEVGVRSRFGGRAPGTWSVVWIKNGEEDESSASCWISGGDRGCRTLVRSHRRPQPELHDDSEW